MQRGQKKQWYGNNNNNLEYYEDFMGGQNQNRTFYTNNRGRGGGRNKHNNQPRICYVNADFLSTNDFNQGNLGNGMRRRVGWGGQILAANDPLHSVTADGRLTTVAESMMEDEAAIREISQISVTVPVNRRLGETRNIYDFNANAGNNSSNRNSRPRSRQIDYASRGEKRQRKERGDNRRHHTKRSKRYKKRREDTVAPNDTGDTSGSDIEIPLDRDVEDEEEDLRYALVRQKIRKTFRREPGEILDSDETTPSSSPKSFEKESYSREDKPHKKEKKSESTASCSKKGIKSSNPIPHLPTEDDCLSHHSHDEDTVEIRVASNEAMVSPHLNNNNNSSGNVFDRPITVESLSQDTLASVTTIPSDIGEQQHQAEIRNSEDRNGSALTKDDGSISRQGSANMSQHDGEVLSPPDGNMITRPPSSVQSGQLVIAENDVGGTTVSSQQDNETNNKPSTSTQECNFSTLLLSSPSLESLPKRTINNKQLSVEREIHQKSPTASTPTKDVNNMNMKAHIGLLKKEVSVLTTKIKEKDAIISSMKKIVKSAEEKDEKIKVLRGKKTQMENETESLKKNLSRVEKSLKDAEQKLKKSEYELRAKNDELDIMKRTADSANSEAAKPDVQLIYAMAYQDRLFVEVEKVKSAFEIEVLKLQEYYESRLAHYRTQGLHPGQFMGVNNSNFPKGCIVTPVNISQPMSVGHQEQQTNSRNDLRVGQHNNNIFAHLGNPETVAPPMINIPPGMTRGTRLPVFLNPMTRRIQQQGIMDTQAHNNNIQLNSQQPSSNNNASSSTISSSTHNGGNGGGNNNQNTANQNQGSNGGNASFRQ